MSPSEAPAWRELPKALLHEHLDGGLRPGTLLELCQARGLPVPAQTADALAEWMHANANAGSLERYLRGFALTVAAMATPDACERVAFEAAEDARLGPGPDLPRRRIRRRLARARGRDAGSDAHRPWREHHVRRLAGADRRVGRAGARSRPALRGLPEQQRAHRRVRVAGRAPDPR